jgi:hypothetical protein
MSTHERVTVGVRLREPLVAEGPPVMRMTTQACELAIVPHAAPAAETEAASLP